MIQESCNHFSVDSPFVLWVLYAQPKMTNKRNLITSSAAEVISGNADLLTEILIRVPAKSLIRFKCVSKHWLSLISDSQFASDHAGRNPRSSISGFYLYLIPWSLKEQQLESVSIDGHTNLPTLAFLDGVAAGSKIRIAHSCNGLMLFSNGDEKPRYIVCNPTTKKYTVLIPELGGASSGAYRQQRVGAYLAFNPSKSPHYEVVLFNYLCAYDGNRYQIEIYRSESSSWKQIHVAARLHCPFAMRVFWNGGIHWIGYKNFHIRFDVGAEKLTEIPMPPSPKSLTEDKIRYFGECGGRLLLIHTRLHSAMGFRIFELERDDYRWIVKCRVNLRPIISVFPEIVHTTGSKPHPSRICRFNVLGVVKGANEKDLTLVLAIPGKIVSCNLKCKTLKVLRDFPPGYSFGSTGYRYVHEFVESLSNV